jgi:hypothetical protein
VLLWIIHVLVIVKYMCSTNYCCELHVFVIVKYMY